MEAAVQTQAPAAPPPTVHERLKSFLSASEPPQTDPPASANVAPPVHSKATPEAERPESAPPEDKQVPNPAEAEADQAEDSDEVQSDDAQSEEQQFSALTELFEAAGLDTDKGLDLEFPVKIDGKEGTAKLRDLVRSYQLDGHHHQKLAKLDTDTKALLADREKFQAESADKLLKMDAGLQTLTRALMGQYSSVDWQKLAAEDPAAYNAQRLALQDHQAMLQDIGRSIEEERAQHQAQQVERFTAHIAEQRKLMEAKIPEWADTTVRNRDKADIMAMLKAEGAPDGAFEQITDCWQASVARKALMWDRLQKSKPAVLNKVKAAPKLLKPGTKQSKDVVMKLATNRERETLRQSGKVKDALPLLKRQLFG